MTLGALATHLILFQSWWDLPHTCIYYTSIWYSSGFLAQELVWEQETENSWKWNFWHPPWHWGPWLPISSSFNPDETCHILVYTIHLCRSASGFLAQELVWEQETENYRKWNFLTPPWHWGPWLSISSSFNPDETCHILVYTIHLCLSTSCFLAQELLWEQETENYRKWNFLTPPWHWGPWLPISSSFNPDETCHILVYSIHLCGSTSGFLAQELVWEQETENSRKWNFWHPHDIGGPGYPSHPLSILMRLATYLYILYIYVVVLAASWHKS